MLVLVVQSRNGTSDGPTGGGTGTSGFDVTSGTGTDGTGGRVPALVAPLCIRHRPGRGLNGALAS